MHTVAKNKNILKRFIHIKMDGCFNNWKGKNELVIPLSFIQGLAFTAMHTSDTLKMEVTSPNKYSEDELYAN